VTKISLFSLSDLGKAQRQEKSVYQNMDLKCPTIFWEELPNFKERALKNIKNSWENLKYRPYNSVILIALG